MQHITNIPFIGPEMDESEYIKALKERGFQFEDVVFFMLARHIPYFHRDGDFETNSIRVTKENYKSFFTNLLQKQIAEWLHLNITLTCADFEKWYLKHFKKKFNFDEWNWIKGNDLTTASALSNNL